MVGGGASAPASPIAMPAGFDVSAEPILMPEPLLSSRAILGMPAVDPRVLHGATSFVTQTVVSGGPPVLLGLPSEILLKVCSMLDVKTLCTLAQTSAIARCYADDPAVWREVCGCGRGLPGHPSHPGMCKEYQRARFIRARLHEAEARQREAERRKAVRRLWKRRLLGCVHALCGAAIILLVMLGSARSEHTQSAGVAPRAVAEVPLQFESVVWESVCKPARNGGGR